MTTLTKSDLVSIISERTGVSKASTKTFLDETIGAITEELVKGNSINLIGFLNLKVSQSAERQGRNPATGESMTIPARKTVKVSIGKVLKEAVNQEA